MKNKIDPNFLNKLILKFDKSYGTKNIFKIISKAN